MKASLPGEPAASGVHLTNSCPLLTGRIVFSCSQKNFNVSENKNFFSGNIFGSVKFPLEKPEPTGKSSCGKASRGEESPQI